MSDKTRFTFLDAKHFRDNRLYIDDDGKPFQREYKVLGHANDHAHAIELGQKAEFPLVADPHEALPLFSYDHFNPAVHPELREALKYKGWRLWTAKVDASHSDYAWFVSLYLGNVYYGIRGSYGLAVGVRRVSPSQ